MRLHIIHAVPKSNDGIERSQRYIRASLRADTEAVFSAVKSGFPSVESELQGMVNGAQVIRQAQSAAADGADGIFVNCFDDPGVYACREFLEVPVFGAYLPAMVTALSLTERVGVLTTDVAGILSEERKARLLGIESRLACVKAVDMGVLSFGNDSQTLLDRLFDACRDMYVNHRVGAVTLGCTAMFGVIDGLRVRLRSENCPITVIEPLQNGVRYLEHIVAQGYTTALRVLPATLDLGANGNG